ncbi:thioesterase domain-containing protein [Clostridium sp.]|jgi:surfactin synthase thioesterase subunit|uniref:thioesterase II family protein n=1 Tax=Clostridium sp. TaxID=1506 RepID=UPI0025832691|nr:thioesterase domain-containing protein [Clostridium sp.]MDF2505617.1 putative thioesterase involved in non-ribosomal peptide biosynthesis [Clostridium sp.]
MSKIKLFCIPHAGGSAAVYSKWKRYINTSIEICPIELAGRGSRFKEDLYNNINEAVEDVYNIIKNDLNNNYAFFGHSMGSLIAYELTYHIMKLKDKPPKHIFFSGRKAPNVIYENNSIHKLSEENLKNKVFEFSGTPKEVLDNVHMSNVFLKILRSDFKVCELYEYAKKDFKLDCNITILNGNKDDIKINHIVSWKQQTSKECCIYFFKGDHFYINNNIESLAYIINSTLGI